MSELHKVIHTLIDVLSGVEARLPLHQAALLHEAVDKDLADSTALDGPDSAPEPDLEWPAVPAPPAPVTNGGDVFTPAEASVPPGVFDPPNAAQGA